MVLCIILKLRIDKLLYTILYCFYLSRAAATSFTGGIYSLSLSEQHMKFGYPIDYHLTFIIFGFIVLLVIFVVAALPESINNHMKEEDVLKYDIMHVISCPPRCSKHCYFA